MSSATNAKVNNSPAKAGEAVDQRGPWNHRLLEAFGIRDGEGARVFFLAGYLVLAVSTFISGRIQRDSLFLSAFTKQDLAYMYISVAVMVPVPALLFARIADRFRRDRLLIGTLLGTAALMLVMRLLLVTGNKLVYILLYNFVEVYGTFLILQFWTFAGDLFSSRQAKRLFPIISSGSVVAGIVCGLAVSGLVKLVGTENLLFLQVLLLLGGAGIIRHVGHQERVRLREAVVREVVRPGRQQTKQGFARTQAQRVFTSKHLKIIAGMTVATFVSVPLIDYQFKVLVKEAFTVNGVVDTDAISAFMGMFAAVTGVVAAVMQLALTGRILERFGVVVALLVLPASLLLGLTGMLVGVASVFACAVFTKGAENSFRYSITDATMQVLYTPVSSQARGRAKTFIDGIIKPLAGGLAGGAMVLLVGPLNLPVSSLAVVAVVLVVCWGGLILMIRREYVRELLSTLRKRRLDFSDKSLVITDAATVEMLRVRLRSENRVDVVNTLELCRRVQGHDLSPELSAILGRDDDELRVGALDTIRHHSSQHRGIQATTLHALFADSALSEDVQAAAVGAYCAVVGESSLEAAVPLLSSTSPAVRGAAVAGIIRHGGLEGVVQAADDLKAMLHDPDEALRFACAHALQEVAIKGFHGQVQSLIADDSQRVRLAAIAAAGAMKAPELIPTLVYMLRHRETTRAAQLALSAYGDEVIAALVKVLRQPKEDPQLRRAVPRVLERIGSRAAFKALMDTLASERLDDTETRKEVAKATGRLRDRLGLPVDDAVSKRLIDAEVQRHYQLLAMIQDLGGICDDPRRDLLRDALDVRRQKSLEGVFRLLAVIHPTKAIETVWGNLHSTSATSRANAIEVLDNLLEAEEKRRLLPLVEAMGELQQDPSSARTLARVLERGKELYTLERLSPDAWLQRLLRGPDPWLVVCALHAVTELGQQRLADDVDAHLSSRNAMVRETALKALSVLWPPDRFATRVRVLVDEQEDPDSVVGRIALRLLRQAESMV